MRIKKEEEERNIFLVRKEETRCVLLCFTHSPGWKLKKNMLVELISGETDIVALAHGIGREEALEM